MAITHDDLSLRKAQERRNARISSQLTITLVAISVFCGLISFILCLAAESSRSDASYYILSVRGDGSQAFECVYNSSGRTPLSCAVCAFLLLAVAMFAEHAYLLLAVAIPESSSLGLTVANEHPRMPSSANTITWQACFLFLVTWICFGLAEILLMIGIGVESGHISDWNKPRPGCHVVRPGMFAAAGIFGLITVFLGFVVYLTALRMHRLQHEEQIAHPGGPAPTPTAPNAPQLATSALQVQPPLIQSVTKTSTSV